MVDMPGAAYNFLYLLCVEISCPIWWLRAVILATREVEAGRGFTNPRLALAAG